MLVHFTPSSDVVVAKLVGCFVLVLAFEATSGFHDTANAVATVIYTNALKPVPAVLWSGLLNFIGVLVGGISVAYALVEILPPDVLTPPDGSPAVPTLVAIFTTALFWNVLTWAFGIPNSSSHCIIGALIGVAAGDALLKSLGLGQGVDWHQIVIVLEALAISPVLGLVGAGGLYGILRLVVGRGHLFGPPEESKPPVLWLRGLLILTCTSVSFSHGTNDGQKSIGLIMLTIIGLMPATFALNPQVPQLLSQLGQNAATAVPLIQRYGDDLKDQALKAAAALQQAGPEIAGQAVPPPSSGSDAGAARVTRLQLRGDVYFLYQGWQLPVLRGTYVFADFVQGRLFAINTGQLPARAQQVYSIALSYDGVAYDSLSSSPLGEGSRSDLRLGEDANGELYALLKGPGTIYRIVAHH